VLSGEAIYDDITSPDISKLRPEYLRTYMAGRFEDSADDTDYFREHKANNRKNLANYMKQNKFTTNDSKNAWKALKEINPEFYNNELPHPTYLKDTTSSSAKKKKSGKGLIQFISSNPAELIKKLDVLISEGSAGNNNVFNEASSIIDELRRQGILSIAQIKKIYKMFI
jgi:hypothetical protein